MTFERLKYGVAFDFVQRHVGIRYVLGGLRLFVGAQVLGIKVGSGDDGFAADKDGALDEVLQLADVSRVGEFRQEAQGIGCKLGVGQSVGFGLAVGEVACQ